jgi:hypothetical protein
LVVVAEAERGDVVGARRRAAAASSANVPSQKVPSFTASYLGRELRQGLNSWTRPGLVLGLVERSTPATMARLDLPQGSPSYEFDRIATEQQPMEKKQKSSAATLARGSRTRAATPGGRPSSWRARATGPSQGATSCYYGGSGAATFGVVSNLDGELGEKNFFGGEVFGFVDVALVPFVPWLPS